MNLTVDRPSSTPEPTSLEPAPQAPAPAAPLPPAPRTTCEPWRSPKEPTPGPDDRFGEHRLRAHLSSLQPGDQMVVKAGGEVELGYTGGVELELKVKAAPDGTFLVEPEGTVHGGEGLLVEKAEGWGKLAVEYRCASAAEAARCIRQLGERAALTAVTAGSPIARSALALAGAPLLSGPTAGTLETVKAELGLRGTVGTVGLGANLGTPGSLVLLAGAGFRLDGGLGAEVNLHTGELKLQVKGEARAAAAAAGPWVRAAGLSGQVKVEVTAEAIVPLPPQELAQVRTTPGALQRLATRALEDTRFEVKVQVDGEVAATSFLAGAAGAVRAEVTVDQGAYLQAFGNPEAMAEVVLAGKTKLAVYASQETEVQGAGLDLAVVKAGYSHRTRRQVLAFEGTGVEAARAALERLRREPPPSLDAELASRCALARTAGP